MKLEPAHRRAEIGSTWLAPAGRRTALDTEAKLLLLAHAFDALGCERVELRTDALNERSRAAIRRRGAMDQGVLRRHVVTDGGRVRDTVVFGIVRDDWPAVRAGLERRLRA